MIFKRFQRKIKVFTMTFKGCQRKNNESGSISSDFNRMLREVTCVFNYFQRISKETKGSLK
jgi:hypothetical protein